MLTTFDLRATDDPQDYLHRTVQTLVEGGIVAVPTESTYGLIAHALNPSGVAQLSEIWETQKNKLREHSGLSTLPNAETSDLPVTPSLLVSSVEASQDYLTDPSPLGSRLARRCWPGPLQLEKKVTPSTDSLVERLCGGALSLVQDTSGRIAFRVIAQRVVEGIHRFLQGPLVFLDLVESDGKPIHSAEHARIYLQDSVPLLLDDGPTRYGGRPTRVNVEKNLYQILHEGVIEEAAMNQFVKPVVVLVCTGNTCRSPMAETLLREQLNKKFGREDLVRVLSAGVAAGNGFGASSQAVEVMGHRGLDLTGHSSQPLDDEIIKVADVILTMTRGHRSAILAAWPELDSRVQTLRRDGGDISDPVGMPVEVYENCANQIDGELSAWIDELDDDFFPSNAGER